MPGRRPNGHFSAETFRATLDPQHAASSLRVASVVGGRLRAWRSAGAGSACLPLPVPGASLQVYERFWQVPTNVVFGNSFSANS